MDRRLDRDRLSVVTGALLLALATGRLLDTPARAVQIPVFGSPLGINLSETTLLLLIIAGMAITGVDSLLRAHPALQEGPARQAVVYWIVPALLSVALASWLSGIGDVGLWTLGMMAAALLIPLALVAEYAAVSPELRRDTWLQWSYSVLIHLVGLILFAALYDARLRALVGAPLIFVGATLLATRLFWPLIGETRRAVLYGTVVGAPLAQLLIVLNYWPISGLQGGLVLLVGFYVLAGLIQHYLRNEPLGRQYVLEYLGVALLATVIILVAIP